jgi:Domain of unknown function (DUF2828)
MSSIIQSLDATANRSRIGENGHNEYGYSSTTDFAELITQVSFQLVRSKTSSVTPLLKNIRFILNQATEKDKDQLNVFYKMIGQTRDVIEGKGEYALAYMLVYEWYRVYPDLARFALESFIQGQGQGRKQEQGRKQGQEQDGSIVHPYGSYKDIKYFCQYVKEQNNNDEDHPLIDFAITLINEQLRQDSEEKDVSKLSLAGKWVARQSSNKFGWLFKRLALDYFREYLVTATTREKVIKATNKSLMDYRKLITGLNRRLDTIQIKQCANQWAKIDHSKTTSITVAKQQKALLNLTKKGHTRSYDQDRITCAENFKDFVNSRISDKKEIKGQRVSIVDFVKSALSLQTKTYGQNATNQLERDILNSQWRDNSSTTGQLDNMIAMVDVSGSMEGDPMLAAIGLGIRIAEKSKLGRRVITFSDKPSWVNLEQEESSFVDMVHKLRAAEWGQNTNIYAAFDMIASAIEQSTTVKPEDCENMILAILSDMQIDEADRKWSSLYQGIETTYSELGQRKFGKPLNPPHIVFWNLRQTNGFPTLTSQQNASMMAGFSPALLNHFCDKGLEALQNTTPWQNLVSSLEGPRYQILGDRFDREFFLKNE